MDDQGLVLPSVFVKIADDSRLGPDLAYWSEDRRTPLPTGQMLVIPDWVAEVLSPSTRENDLGPKRDGAIYAESDALSCFGVETASLFPF